MNFEGFGDWLLTKNGKRFSSGVAAAVGISIIGIKILPNTIFLDKYKETVHLYREGMPVPLSDVCKQRFEKAIKLVGVEEKKRKLFKPFSFVAFDTFHAGIPYTRYGAIIGTAANFIYSDVHSIDKSLIRVNEESVGWGSDEATQLLESLVIPENAQLYAIAREIKTADSPKLIYETVLVTFALTFCYGLSRFLNTRLNTYTKSKSIRIMLYGLVSGFALANYLFIKDFIQIHYEQRVDEFLKNKDPIFAEGGREYYAKILQRNKALRKLLGKEGESKFSAQGNENFFLRQRHVPLVYRKDLFESKLVN